jgi:type IV secretory pathway VirB10-like protein
MNRTRTRALATLAACALLPVSLGLGCRAEDDSEPVAERSADALPSPLADQGWTGDPASVPGLPATTEEGAATVAERERRLAEREAAVAEREAAVARRETAPVAPVRRAPVHRAPAVSRPPARDPEPAPVPVRRSATLTVPAGTSLAAELLGGLSSATAQAGDAVSARLTDDVLAEGELAIPAGSTLRGSVTEAQGLGRVGGRSRLALRFDRVELPSGTEVPLYATWQRLGRNETRRDAATIGGSTVGGAVLGRVIRDRDHRDRNTAIGAAVGAAVGTVIAARNNRNGEVELADGAALDLTLADSARVRVSR